MGQDKALAPVGSGHAPVPRRRAGFVRSRRRAGPLRDPTTPALAPAFPPCADVEPGLGPLGALRTALEDAAPRGVLLLAVDLPFVPVALSACLLRAVRGLRRRRPPLVLGPRAPGGRSTPPPASIRSPASRRWRTPDERLLARRLREARRPRRRSPTSATPHGSSPTSTPTRTSSAGG